MTDDDKFHAIDGRFRHVEGRLDRHERRLSNVETARAVGEKAQEHLDGKFAELRKHIDDEIAAIKRPLNTMITVVFLALAGAFMTFVIQGGLSAG